MVIDNLIWSSGQFYHSWMNSSWDWLMSNDQNISKFGLGRMRSNWFHIIVFKCLDQTRSIDN
jgi:hypothetical protein